MKNFKTVTRQVVINLICDGCGLQASADGDYEFQEFISIDHHCGYSSIHGDGKQIDIDLCQQCFADMCGDTLRVRDERNSIAKDNERNQLEYSNIFDVICQSKAKARQLKCNSDMRLVVRDILLKNRVANNNELTVALKRVEQLWDAQYLSAEGNELQTLANLICAYEKKDWYSFFEEVPLADDDFMPDRPPCNEEKTARDLSPIIPNSTKMDDDKQYLLEGLTRVMAKCPEFRLGQLLANAINLQQPCPELFMLKIIY